MIGYMIFGPIFAQLAVKIPLKVNNFKYFIVMLTYQAIHHLSLSQNYTLHFFIDLCIVIIMTYSNIMTILTPF